MELQEWVAKFPDRAPDGYRNELMAKPTQFRDADRFVENTVNVMMEHDLMIILLYLLEKADGHSCILECLPDGTWRLSHRTETNSVLLDRFDMRPYLTPLAFALRVTFLVELCALYNGEELGFLEVRAMLCIFKDNNCQNVAPFQLLIRPFGVYSITHDGSVRSGACVETGDLFRFLDACIVPDNALVRRVTFTEVSCRRQGSSLEFLSHEGGEWVSPNVFFQESIRKAASLRIEGFVLRGIYRKLELPDFTRDTYGKKLPRHDAQLKLKHVFLVNLVACKVFNAHTRIEEIWLFGRKGSRHLAYAGQANDHAILQSKLQRCLTSFRFKNEAEKQELKTLYCENLSLKRASFVPFAGTCTNFSWNFKVTGLKYDLTFSKEHVIDFESLSEPERVARGSPHFNKTKAASDRFANELGRFSAPEGKKAKAKTAVPKPARQTAAMKPANFTSSKVVTESVIVIVDDEPGPPPSRKVVAEPVIVIVDDEPGPSVSTKAVAPPAVKKVRLDKRDDKPPTIVNAPSVAVVEIGPIARQCIMTQLLAWGGNIFKFHPYKIGLSYTPEEAQIIVTLDDEQARSTGSKPHFTLAELKARFESAADPQTVWDELRANVPQL